MTLTREQLHNIRSKLGAIALVADISDAYTESELKKFMDIIRANIRAINEILDGLSESEHIKEMN